MPKHLNLVIAFGTAYWPYKNTLPTNSQYAWCWTFYLLLFYKLWKNSKFFDANKIQLLSVNSSQCRIVLCLFRVNFKLDMVPDVLIHIVTVFHCDTFFIAVFCMNEINAVQKFWMSCSGFEHHHQPPTNILITTKVFLYSYWLSEPRTTIKKGKTWKCQRFYKPNFVIVILSCFIQFHLLVERKLRLWKQIFI